MRITLIDTVRDGTVAAFFQRVIPMHVNGAEYTQFSVHEAWGVTAGTWTWEVSNDLWANQNVVTAPQYAAARWVDVTAAVGLTNPTGVANNDWVFCPNYPVYMLRVTYTPGVASGMLFLAVTLTV